MLKRSWVFNTAEEEVVVRDEMTALAASQAESLGWNSEDIESLRFSVKMALAEALINHLKHGNEYDLAKRVSAEAYVLQEANQTRVVYESVDEGTGFNPNDVPDPTDPDNLERPCGRGLLLIRHYIKKYNGTLEFMGCGNRVQISVCLATREKGQNGE